MITILAEKPDVGNKIAAALDKITLHTGKVVDFSSLKSNEKAVKSQQFKDGYLKINWQGEECIVTWGFGHLCQLKQASDYNPEYKAWSKIPLPYIPERYEIKLSNADQKSHFKLISDFMNKSDYIINACDDDREGELIFAYIYELAKCKKPVKRARFSSQTKEGLKRGFTTDLKDGKDMKDLEASGRMRSIADWVVGANLTTIMSLKRPGQGVISIGRVQTPTLAMIVDREEKIKNFKSEPYYTLEAEFTTSSKETFKAKYEEEKIMDRTIAEGILKDIERAQGTIFDIEKKESKKKVPSLYSLDALQMDANSKFGFTLSETLEIAQKLYDNGYTTYPRTDSCFLTEDMEPVINDVLDKISKTPDYAHLINGRKRVYDFKSFFDDSKVESHFAIIPTGNIPSGLSDKENKIYDLIARSVIKMLYGPATLEKTKVSIGVDGYVFIAAGSTIKEKGWMEVGDTSKEEFLPELNIGDVLDGVYSILDKKTEPPKRYTEKTLLAAMLSAGKDLTDKELKKIMSDPETGGIGTVATRASILETIIQRGYVTRDKKSLVATEKGISLINDLPLDSFKSAELTAKWEKRLRDIARGKESKEVFQKDFEETTKKWVKEIEDKVKTVGSAPASSPPTSSTGTSLVCPKCKKPLRKMAWGYGCSGYSEGCKWSIGSICNKKITDRQVEKLVTSGKTEKIKGFTSKAGKKFDAVLILKPDGSIGFDFTA